MKNPLEKETWVGELSKTVEADVVLEEPSSEPEEEIETPPPLDTVETKIETPETAESETQAEQEPVLIIETEHESEQDITSIGETSPSENSISSEETTEETLIETPQTDTQLHTETDTERTEPAITEVEGFTTIAETYSDTDLSADAGTAILAEKELQVEKLQSVMVYAKSADAPQVAYQLSSDRIKESIILDRLPEGTENPVYRFQFDGNGMEAVLREDDSVMFKDKTTGEEIFLIQSPYMLDKEGIASAAIDVTLTAKDGGYEYTLTPSREWLAEEDRAYPVVIDPTVITVQGALELHDTTVAYSDRTSKLGTRLEGDRMITIKMGKLGGVEVGGLIYIPMPTFIPDAARVINARMYLCGYRDKYENCSVDTTLAAYAVTSDWDQANFNINKVLYNNSTPTIPTNETRAQDYKILNDTDRYGIHKQPFYFDITEAAGRWASGELENRGIIYRHVGNTASERYMQFYSCNVSACAPALIIQYRDTKGVEDYWTYTTMEAGLGGILAVNNFNGNVTFVQPLLSVAGERMPVSLNLLYDSTRRASGGEGFGNAWRTNYHLQVKTSTLEGYPYYLIDADGTEHYFFSDEGTYKDEDGLGYILTVTGSGSSATYRITDKEKNKYDFDSSGRLTKITDEAGLNSNQITYTSGSGSAGLISKITDGAGGAYTFQYQSGTSLVSKITDPSGRATTFTYSGNWMTGMSFAGKTISFTTNSGGINKITAPDGSYATIGGHVAYDHFFGTDLKWYGSNGTLYQHYSLDYGTNTTRITSSVDAGLDVTYQFNNYGQTVNVQDNITGLGQCYLYGAPGGANGDANKILTASKTLAATKNLVTNSSLKSNITGYTQVLSATGVGSVAYDSSKGHFEKGSMKITQTTSEGTVSGTQTILIPKTGSYTLSAYFFTGGGAASTDKGVGLKAVVTHSDGSKSTYTSAPLMKLGDSDWTRLPLTFEAAAGETVELSLGFCLDDSQTGTVWVDDVQLESGGGATSINLLTNPDLAGGSTG